MQFFHSVLSLCPGVCRHKEHVSAAQILHGNLALWTFSFGTIVITETVRR